MNTTQNSHASNAQEQYVSSLLVHTELIYSTVTVNRAGPLFPFPQRLAGPREKAHHHAMFGTRA
jgi:hypothetical protein